MEPLAPGQNPRDVLPRHRERGPKRFEYTVETIAAAAGLALSYVRGYRSRVFESLSEVVEFVQHHAQRRSRVLTDAEAAERLFPDPYLRSHYAARWERRWPRFQPYGCASVGCSEVIFQPGFCYVHGGSKKPAVRLSGLDGGYFQVLVGPIYKPLHRLVMGEPAGLDVHHLDENRWNNHPSNLAAVSHGEHFRSHGGLSAARAARKAAAPSE